MNTNPPRPSALLPTLAGVLGSFLIVAALVWAMYLYTRPAPVNQARIEERKKALSELQATSVDALRHYGWVDANKGLVRLKIGRAMDLVVQEYKNPAAFRTNLLSRVEKATAPPPPAVNPFE